MLKKILSAAFAVLVSIGIFAGCALTTQNTPRFFNQVVAEIRIDDFEREFTMRDLLTAWNSFGFQFEQQQGMNREDAVRATVRTMVQRAVLVNELQGMLDISEYKEDLMREVFENINQQLAQIETQIRTAMGINPEEEPDTAPTEPPLRTPKVEWEPRFEMVNGQLVRIQPNTTGPDLTPAGDFQQVITDEPISREAMRRYLSALRAAANEEGLNLTDEELLDREIDRIYTILVENRYISLFEEQFIAAMAIDTGAVVNRFQQGWNRDFELFSAEAALGFPSYHAAMRSDSTAVHFHPVTGHYLNVTHVLVRLSAEQNADINLYRQRLQSGSITQDVFDDRLDEIKNNTFVEYNRPDGSVARAHIDTVYSQIYSAVVSSLPNNTDFDLVNRARAFDQFIYRFGDDPGIMNRDFAYTVNLFDHTGIRSDLTDSMIPEFTQASRDLHFVPNTNNQQVRPRGGAGELSDLVFAEFQPGQFGFHIILNLGVVENIVPAAGNIDTLSWTRLWNTRTQPSTDKTLFDVIYDQLGLGANAASARMDEIVRSAMADDTYNLFERRIRFMWS